VTVIKSREQCSEHTEVGSSADERQAIIKVPRSEGLDGRSSVRPVCHSQSTNERRFCSLLAGLHRPLLRSSYRAARRSHRALIHHRRAVGCCPVQCDA